MDVAPEVGLDFRQGAFRWGVTPDPAAMMGGGLCWLDYDEDGWLDLFVVNSYALAESDRWQAGGGLPRSALFHNVEGEFVDVSSGSRRRPRPPRQRVRRRRLRSGWSHRSLRHDAPTVGALLWNEGDGTFTEGAEAAGVEAFGWYAGAAVGDVDGDGWPDLFLSGYANVNAPIEGATQGFPNTNLGRARPAVPERRVRRADRVTGSARSAWRRGSRSWASSTGSARCSPTSTATAISTSTWLTTRSPNRLYENVPWPGGAEADPAGLGFRFEERAAAGRRGRPERRDGRR